MAVEVGSAERHQRGTPHDRQLGVTGLDLTLRSDRATDAAVVPKAKIYRQLFSQDFQRYSDLELRFGNLAFRNR